MSLNLLKQATPAIQAELLKGFWTDFAASLANAIITPVSNLLQDVSLLGAHVLAGLSQETDVIGAITGIVGKRQLREGFWTDLADSLLSTTIGAANNLLAGLSLTLAQTLAGFGLGSGIPTVPSGRELREGFWTDLGNSLLGLATDVANGALSSLSLTAAQLLASFGLGAGIPTVPTGRALSELNERFLSSLINTLSNVGNTITDLAVSGLNSVVGGINTGINWVNNSVVVPLQDASLLVAHVLAGLSLEDNVIGALGNVIGRRDLEDLKGFLDTLSGLLNSAINTVTSTVSTVTNALTDFANPLLADLALLGAQGLAGFALGNQIPSLPTIG